MEMTKNQQNENEILGLFSTSVSKELAANGESACQLWQRSTGRSVDRILWASPASDRSIIGDEEDPTQISIFARLPQNILAGAMLMAPLRLFRDAFSEALIAHMHSSVRPGGKLLLPYVEDKIATSTGFWSIDWLGNLFGNESGRIAKPRYAEFNVSGDIVKPLSIFSAFVSEAPRLAANFHEEQNKVKNIDYLKNHMEFLEITRQAPTEMVHDDISRNIMYDELGNFFARMTYSVMGASYKTESLRRFANRYMPGREALTVTNIGGGMGFVDLELLLTYPSIAHVTNCEPYVENFPMTKFLYEKFQSVVKGRYTFALTSAQDYHFERKNDIISDFASLLLVPREKLRTTLDKAWSSLNSGGIMIVHENIKRQLFAAKSYYNQVFSVDELETYLKRYGAIDYYRSSDICPMMPATVKDLTVFRVIQKK